MSGKFEKMSKALEDIKSGKKPEIKVEKKKEEPKVEKLDKQVQDEGGLEKMGEAQKEEVGEKIEKVEAPKKKKKKAKKD